MKHPLIDAVDISKNFGDRPALRDISLTISSGDRLAILGPNSAGKSTLLRLLSGLSRPSTGHVESVIRSSNNRHRDLRSVVGYLGHASMLYPVLSPLENLELSGKLYGIPKPKTRGRFLLDELGLAEFGDEQVRTLSSGVSRRVAVARALVHEPKVLLLDEPFAGLDHQAAERLETLLDRALKSDIDRALVLVSHDLAGAARLTDEAVFLCNGKHRSLGRPSCDSWTRAYREARDSLEIAD